MLQSKARATVLPADKLGLYHARTLRSDFIHESWVSGTVDFLGLLPKSGKDLLAPPCFERILDSLGNSRSADPRRWACVQREF